MADETKKAESQKGSASKTKSPGDKVIISFKTRKGETIEKETTRSHWNAIKEMNPKTKVKLIEK